MQTRILLLICGTILASPAAAQEIGDAALGRIFVQQVCAECHAVLRGDTDSPNPMATSLEALAQTPGMTATALFVHLQTSHPTMPNFVFEPEDSRNIVAYVLSLKE